jgi:hypothetical protein
VPVVGCGGARGLAEDQGQNGLAALERLNLRLLVDAEHHGAVRRVQVEANDVADLLHEELVVAECEGPSPMRFEVKRTPHA